MALGFIILSSSASVMRIMCPHFHSVMSSVVVFNSATHSLSLGCSIQHFVKDINMQLLYLPLSLHPSLPFSLLSSLPLPPMGVSIQFQGPCHLISVTLASLNWYLSECSDMFQLPPLFNLEIMENMKAFPPLFVTTYRLLLFLQWTIILYLVLICNYPPEDIFHNNYSLVTRR